MTSAVRLRNSRAPAVRAADRSGIALNIGTASGREYIPGGRLTHRTTESRVNKTRMIETLARRTGLTPAQARTAVDGLFDPESGVISTALQHHQTLKIKGFGTFETRKRNARKGRNPRTGEPIRISASTSVAFRAGKGLRASLK